MGRNDVLTDTQREYLKDPDGFDRADSTIRKMNYDLRKKAQACQRDANLVDRFLSGEPIPEPSDGTIANPGGSCVGDDYYYPKEGTENRYTLLTPTEREFIMDPEGYAEDHAQSTVSNLKRNIKEKLENWEEDWELILETRERWDWVWLTSEMDADCLACGKSEKGEIKSWLATQYDERDFEDWVDGPVLFDEIPRCSEIKMGFCPDCSHIRKETREMAIEKGKVPCYSPLCDANTHRLDSKPFRDCWKSGSVYLYPEDMDTILQESNHVDERTEGRIRGLYQDEAQDHTLKDAVSRLFNL